MDTGALDPKTLNPATFDPTTVDYENVTQYAYDELGRLQAVTAVERNNTLVDISSEPGNQPDATQYAYDLSGRLEQTFYSNGLVHD